MAGLFYATHWRRVRLGKAPDERDMNPDKRTSLELSVRAYAEKCPKRPGYLNIAWTVLARL